MEVDSGQPAQPTAEELTDPQLTAGYRETFVIEVSFKDKKLSFQSIGKISNQTANI